MGGLGRVAISIWWVEPRVAAKHPNLHRTPPQERMISLKVLKLRNPALKFDLSEERSNLTSF